MRKTAVLNAIHIGRLIKKKWFEQGKLKFLPSSAEQVLKDNNIRVYKLEELDPQPEPVKRTDFLVPVDLPLDENHPDWNPEPCFIYGDNDVLLEGIDQARVLTNTEEISQLTPALRNLESQIDLPDHVHQEAKRKIMQSCIFDAYQEKLPKRKDPLRPAYNFRRDYGITDSRKIKLLFNNLIQLCELQNYELERSILVDGFFSLPMRAFNKIIQFEVAGDFIVRSQDPLPPPIESEETERKSIPNLYPVNCTVSMKPYHFYNEQNIFPLTGEKLQFVHTVLIGFNRTQVLNIHEEEVTESQMLGRNLLKAFSIAGAQARAKFGAKVEELFAPVVVQVIMTDGKYFHFSVFQLNTLNVEGTQSYKNIYWNSPIIPLYDKCEYHMGQPILEGYNPTVLKRMVAFYKNQ